MIARHLTLFLLLLSSSVTQAQQPPYGGTIFFDPDIILPTDSSVHESTTYIGKGDRTVFDRRVNNWVTINAFLFDVVWKDTLTSVAVVNPEFATVAAATVEAEKYGWIIGQLPKCLRKDVDEIWIHQGVEPFGGGNQSILIHTGKTVEYENDGILEETLVHEACHTSLDATHADSPGWLDAQNLDPTFISTYAQDYPDREDIAESYLPWLAVRHRADRISQADYDIITSTIPNRLAYFDGIACNLSPIEPGGTTSLDQQPLAGGHTYPNPVRDVLYLDAPSQDTHIQIMDLTGRIVVPDQLYPSSGLSVGHLLPGVYVLRLTVHDQVATRKVVVSQ